MKCYFFSLIIKLANDIGKIVHFLVNFKGTTEINRRNGEETELKVIYL